MNSLLISGILLAGWPGILENTSQVAGLEYAQNLADDTMQHSQVFYQQKLQWSADRAGGSARYHLQVRLVADSEGADPLEKLIAFVEKPWGDFKLNIGWQEISWGENLLLPILDVVNPRDVGYLRGFYDTDAKQASPMLLTEWRSGIWEAQLIAVPWAIRSRQPAMIGTYEIADARSYRAGQDGEYGGRLGVFVNGIDAKVYSFYHHPREPAYRFQAFSGDQDIIIDERMVNTEGASFSYAASSWLLRGDVARHLNFPATAIATRVERTTLSQGILGLNYTSDDGRQTLGVEWHSDFWKTLPEVYSKGAWTEADRQQTILNWVAMTGNLSFQQGLLEPQAFLLQGVDNRDRLWRLILNTHVNEAINLSVDYQKTEAATTSPKVLLNSKETLAVRCSYAW